MIDFYCLKYTFIGVKILMKYWMEVGMGKTQEVVPPILVLIV